MNMCSVFALFWQFEFCGRLDPIKSGWRHGLARIIRAGRYPVPHVEPRPRWLNASDFSTNSSKSSSILNSSKSSSISVVRAASLTAQPPAPLQPRNVSRSILFAIASDQGPRHAALMAWQHERLQAAGVNSSNVIVLQSIRRESGPPAVQLYDHKELVMKTCSLLSHEMQWVGIMFDDTLVPDVEKLDRELGRFYVDAQREQQRKEPLLSVGHLYTSPIFGAYYEPSEGIFVSRRSLLDLCESPASWDIKHDAYHPGGFTRVLKRLPSGFALKAFPRPNQLTVSMSSVPSLHDTLLHTRPLAATGVIQGKQTDASKGGLDDIAVLVITGAGMERKRLDLVVKSWAQFHPPSVFFFSEAQQVDFDLHPKSTFVHVDSPGGHAGTHKVSLMLKHAVDTMLGDPRGFKWFVFADDDTYVRLPVLSQLLRQYELRDDEEPRMLASCSHPEFPNGGAGIALSRSWVERYAKQVRQTPSASPDPADQRSVLRLFVCCIARDNEADDVYCCMVILRLR